MPQNTLLSDEEIDKQALAPWPIDSIPKEQALVRGKLFQVLDQIAVSREMIARANRDISNHTKRIEELESKANGLRNRFRLANLFEPC